MSGTGWLAAAPTCAANVTAYLAMARPGLRALYAGEDMRKDAFADHMEELYRFVTPGSMGLNRVEPYASGVVDFAASRGLTLKAHVFEVSGFLSAGRPPLAEVTEFVREGLAGDCPVAFLNLTKGRVKNIQGWHWITIVSAELDGRAPHGLRQRRGQADLFRPGAVVTCPRGCGAAWSTLPRGSASHIGTHLREKGGIDMDAKQWFRDAKFGMMIHWGPLLPAGRRVEEPAHG